jgi:hypothetical protein
MKLQRLLFVITLFLLVPVLSFAQIIAPSGNGPLISSITKPETVRSFSPALVSISSTYIDLNSSYIQWIIGGKVMKEGIGITDFDFTSGPIGSPTVITVSLKTLNGLTHNENITILPVNINFISQAKTYTPPFYKGKASFTGESELTITAFADITNKNGGVIDPNGLRYEWSVDDNGYFKQSGFNKKSFSFMGSMWNKPQEVSVLISSLDGSINAKYSEIFRPVTPEVVVYEEDPLLGTLFNKAVTSPFLITKGKEVTFFAAPFNMILDNLSADTLYSWKMNGVRLQNQENGNSITFRDDTGKNGDSYIALEIKQPTNSSQRAKTNFIIRFK